MPDTWLQRRGSGLEPKRPPNLSPKEYARSLLIAHVIGSHVAHSGDIPGFSAWQSKHGERETRIVTSYAFWAGVKVERDNRDPEECAKSGAEAVQHRLESDRQAYGHRSQVQIVPGMIGRIFAVAVAINAMCDDAKTDPKTRKRMHEMHGEMIARGASDSREITRTIAAALGVAEVSVVDTLGVGVALEQGGGPRKRVSDQEYFEGRNT